MYCNVLYRPPSRDTLKKGGFLCLFQKKKILSKVSWNAPPLSSLTLFLKKIIQKKHWKKKGQ